MPGRLHEHDAHRGILGSRRRLRAPRVHRLFNKPPSRGVYSVARSCAPRNICRLLSVCTGDMALVDQLHPMLVHFPTGRVFVDAVAEVAIAITDVPLEEDMKTR